MHMTRLWVLEKHREVAAIHIPQGIPLNVHSSLHMHVERKDDWDHLPKSICCSQRSPRASDRPLQMLGIPHDCVHPA
jgi:hypothetical protein